MARCLAAARPQPATCNHRPKPLPPHRQALSKRNEDPAAASRPWDRDRDGFVMGEGAGGLLEGQWRTEQRLRLGAES